MKKATIIAALLISSAATTFAQTWNVDKAHSRIGFNVTHLSVADLGGTFNSIDAKITSAKPDFSDAAVEFSADINSINTDNEQRDKHLQTADFFDAEKFPKLTFKSTSWKKVADKKYKVAGDLTLHGVTKPVVLDVVFNGTSTNPMSKKTIAGFNITGKVKRSEFGVAPSMPAAMLSDEVTLLASTEFAKD
ncbi:MAG: YceI family protein [Niastella sp.]|jgi:polyisoprenoid-binding protein YceI|uniref:YceI family protein n=1 Tax=Niastella sp. TaxID=1869183 RepID=UPI00389A0075